MPITITQEERLAICRYFNVRENFPLTDTDIELGRQQLARLNRTPLSMSVLDNARPELQRNNEVTRGYTLRNESIPPFSLSLGWELEANHAAIKTPGGIQEHSDASVNGDGEEYVVMPTLVNSPSYVLGLLKELTHTPGLNTDQSCGFHVHMAPRKCNKKLCRRWALIVEKLGMAVEEKAFLAVPPARIGNSFCKKITPTVSGTFFDGSKYDNHRRYQWVNVVEMFRPSGIKTVEIRLLGNTHRWRYVLAWVAFCMELGRAAWIVLHRPEEMESMIQGLNNLLDKIQAEIKPLEFKKADVPAWVWSVLDNHGIIQSKFERPLKPLAVTETRIKNPLAYILPYNDLQPEIANPELCMHDVDRENDRCEYCDHNEGNCQGAPDCEECREDLHLGGGDCRASWCRSCTIIGQRQSEVA